MSLNIHKVDVNMSPNSQMRKCRLLNSRDLGKDESTTPTQHPKAAKTMPLLTLLPCSHIYVGTSGMVNRQLH